MKKLILIGLLALVLIAATFPLKVTGVAQTYKGLMVGGTIDCRSRAVVVDNHAVGKTLYVVIVPKVTQPGKVCDKPKGWALVVSQKKYKTVVVNGKTWKPR